MQDKHTLRTAMRKARAALSPDIRREIDTGIFAHLTASDAYIKAGRIMLYCSVNDEIDTWAVIDHCFRQGKTVLVPRCESGGMMHAYRISGIHDLIPGTMGILEPAAHCTRESEMDLIIVPCLCADRKGFRIGYGGGYYDRFLPQVKAKTAALCAHSRLLDTVYPEKYDYPCDLIITERGVFLTYEK